MMRTGKQLVGKSFNPDKILKDYRTIGNPIPKVRESLADMLKNVTTNVIPKPEGSSYLKDVSGLHNMLDHIDELEKDIEELYRNGNIPQALYETEMDSLKKVVMLTGRSGSGHVESEGFTTSTFQDIESISYLSSFFRIGDYDEFRDLLSNVNVTVTRGTNHGWPTYVPGGSPLNTVDLQVHLWLSDKLVNDFGGDIYKLEKYIKEKTGVIEPISSLLLFRFQGIGKSQSIYELGDKGPVYKYDSKGEYPRTRLVFAVPAVINNALRRKYNAIRASYKKYENFSFKSPEHTLAFLKSFKNFDFFSEDLSGYDRSVSSQTQKKLLRELYSKVFSPAEAKIYEQCITLGTLAPPLDSVNDAFMYNREGQTTSGFIGTDKDGTLINFSRIVDCMAHACNWSIEQTLKNWNLSWTCLVFSDDCVIGTSEDISFDRERYNEKSISLNFKTTSLPGVTYLMNYFDLENNLWHGIMSRALDSTYNKERRVTDEFIEMFGMYNRWKRSEKHPLFDKYFNKILKEGVLLKYNIRDFKDLENFSRSPFLLNYIDEYGKLNSNKAQVRDMLAGLTHGTMDLNGIYNTSLDLNSLLGITSLLDNETLSEEDLRVDIDKVDESDIFDFIHFSKGVKPKGYKPLILKKLDINKSESYEKKEN